MALEPLFAVMDATILDSLRRRTNGAGGHERKPSTRNSTFLSLHLKHYPLKMYKTLLDLNFK
jgi:hypothetical protein